MRAWVLASLAVLLLVPTVVLAQGGPPPLPNPHPSAAEVPPQAPPDPARRAAVLAAREALDRQRGVAPADARTTPKPPDTISPAMRAQRPPRSLPTGPPPAAPPRRSEDPTERLLQLLSLNNDPAGQSGIQCGAGTQSYQPDYYYEYVRGYMFCHSPSSFFTSQSQVGIHTHWVTNPCCSEAQYEIVLDCARWAYDWQGWYCPADPAYSFDFLQCNVWSRVLDYVDGSDPLGSTYEYIVTTPWRQGCQVT